MFPLCQDTDGQKEKEFNVTLTILKQEKEAKLTVQATK